MNIAQIETNLKKLIASFSKESFIYDLLLAYGLPKASITRLKKGNLNLSKVAGEVSWKKKLFFKEEYEEDLHLAILSLRNELKQDQRFVIVTDYKTLLAIDTKTGDKLDIALLDLPKHYDFFLPWAGMEKSQHQNENPADVKAAVNMAKLFDAIQKDNSDDSLEFIHGLNVFLSRLLFCFFAEDTHIFEDNQFTNAIDSHTQADGSDLNSYLDNLFEVMNTPEDQREELPEYLNNFPYVNGGLFKDKHPAPSFTRSSRAALLASGDQDWSAINPDIFGSMFQAVISTDQRGSLGQHYTSVPNIMKVIEPLFLNDLYEAFEKAKGNPKKLTALLVRLEKIKIFDPACGSGNFLIIAYKELRKLEMAIIKEAQAFNFSRIHLSNFYGIEIDDFAHEIAKLALWLAEHQMNVEFLNEFGRTNPTLPLKDAGQIVQGNATRLNWEEVCPKTNTKNEPAEVYILGNPPYLGSSMQSNEQKNDMSFIFGGAKGYKNLDYIACWVFLGAKYVRRTNAQLAFVSTNSICQGEQVALLWPKVFKLGLEISFAHQSFKWTNSAKGNAGVTCVVVGIRNDAPKPKYLHKDGLKIAAKNINPYLVDADNVILPRRGVSISGFPKILRGDTPTDGGHLLFTTEEREAFLSKCPEAISFMRKIVGSAEFIRGLERWCLWVTETEAEAERAFQIDCLNTVFEEVAKFRRNSKAQSTVDYAAFPYKFRQIQHKESSAIIIPRVTSERRQYMPCGFLDKGTIILDSAQVVYDPEAYIFAIISSRIHMCWVRAVAGQLETRIRYSSALCYNGFPFPSISTQRKNEITQCVFRILEEREKHSDKTLAELYDPDKMPEGLREAHHLNDLAIERCYRSKPFESDEERLEYLFKLYEKMIQEEKDKGTLFAKEQKTRRKSKP